PAYFSLNSRHSVSVKRSHPSRKYVILRIFVATLLRVKPEDEKDQIASPRRRRAINNKKNKTPVEMRTQVTEFSFQQALKHKLTFSSDVRYIFPPIEEMIGSSGGKRSHQVCFEFYLAPRPGVLKNPLTGTI